MGHPIGSNKKAKYMGVEARYDLFCVKSAVKPQPTNQHGGG